MSGRKDGELGDITLLGNKSVQYKQDYAPEVLETFPNKHPNNDYFVKFNCPEFTSLALLRASPILPQYIFHMFPAKKWLKANLLTLSFQFQKHGDFHEDCMNIIMKDLIKLMDPKYIEVWGKFTPRGGLSIDPYCNYGKPGTKWKMWHGTDFHATT